MTDDQRPEIPTKCRTCRLRRGTLHGGYCGANAKSLPKAAPGSKDLELKDACPSYSPEGF